MAKFIWFFIAIIGAFAFGTLALHKGESINAIWLVTAAICIYAIGYRFYGSFIAQKVLKLDATRATPAYIHNDGKNFTPTNKYVLFGHHFAAIAGAGPLVGPVLAAQMGYLPSMIWLLVGVVLAGAVQDFVILVISSRHDGKSLGEMIKMEMGNTAGSIIMLGIFFIMIMLVAILAMVVVKALANSPWGLFTITMTIPIALIMGIWMRFIRPGRVVEASIMGAVLLLVAIWGGGVIIENPELKAFFTLSEKALAIALIIYGFLAAVLPVWLLLAPRDYLSTFLKLGVIFSMAIAIIVVAPQIKMPAITNLIDGTGPVFAGSIFPFLFVTIACGAISGFHSLVSSGTTPKMAQNEKHMLFIGYGAMLMESLTGVMALIAAVILTPGLYFAINSPAGFLGHDLVSATEAIRNLGFVITPEEISNLASNIGEDSILSRTGGAPTFAIGLTLLFHEIFGGVAMMPYWYHFAILFEALFILTTVDAGTRVGRFMIQDIISNVYRPAGNSKSLFWGIIATAICRGGWGYLLYSGLNDPMGGIYTLWPLFGISNQMLACIALMFATVILFKKGLVKFSFITIIPGLWVLITTVLAGIAKLLPANGERIHDTISHVAKISELKAKLPNLTDPATIAKTKALIFNNTIDAVLCTIFIVIIFVMLFQTIKVCTKILHGDKKSYPLRESRYENAKNYLNLNGGAR